MKSNQISTDESKAIVNRNKKFFLIENFNYLYPNGHRMTHQMRWFKGSLDRDLRSKSWLERGKKIIINL